MTSTPGTTAADLFDVFKQILDPRDFPFDADGALISLPDPPLWLEQQAKNKRKTKTVNRILAELSDEVRRDIAVKAARVAAGGWSG